MRRFLILLLILLLPLQVFAGNASDRLTHAQTAPQASMLQRPSAAFEFDRHQSTPGIEQAAATTSDTQDNSDDELTNHAVFGDEAMPSSFLVFAAISPVFISSLHNDAAPIPPYLPPAARPPQI